MSTNPDQDPQVDDELRLQAVSVLTALARRTYSTDHGPHRIDFADRLALIVSSVAANVGGTDALLAGRPGSWEADLVAQLVNGTIGPEGDYLAGYRTEPIQVWIDPEAQLEDVHGPAWAEAWDALQEALDFDYEDAYTAALERHAGEPFVVPPARRRLVQNSLMAPELSDEQRTVWQEITREADRLQDVDPALAAAGAALVALSAEQDRQEREYGAALLAAAQAEAARLGYTVPVVATSDYDEDNWIGEQLERHARTTVPAPEPPAPAADKGTGR